VEARTNDDADGSAPWHGVHHGKGEVPNFFKGLGACIALPAFSSLAHGASRAAHGFDAVPHPITYYLWGIGTAPYWGASGSTASALLSSINAAAVHSDEPARIAKSYGLKLMTYEGGPELPAGALATQTNMTDRPASPNMRDTIVDNFNDWIRSGGDMAIYYIHSWFGNAPNNWTWVYDDGRGGNAWNLNSPKMNAVQEIAAAAPVAVALDGTGLSTGTAIPGTAPGGKYSMMMANAGFMPTPPRTGTATISASNAWQNLAGYVFLSPDSATRAVTASLSGGGTVAAFVDGVRLGATQTASGTVAFGTVALGPVELGGITAIHNGPDLTILRVAWKRRSKNPPPCV